ncbi:ImmA/IrrE family metallo-endopeptidase [Paenibacillus sepulcri]|uniref:ImmA/IrrE family metallo-endopeptidase n=1 Tax=Paenibacillus sepulcri TaxID=359917 RepID=A0ABS7CBQ7_9BACL|nr:ImmA/IrrE family metallo-endopeptidase [Paenibacillus sepulcri]
MNEIITKLIRRFQTNDPFEIARGLGIHIRFLELAEGTRGLYYKKLRRRFIVINDQLDDNWQRFVCAHELAHDRLHPGLSRFLLDEQSFYNVGKYERQANKFAVRLLTASSPPVKGETIEKLLKRNGIPEEMQSFFY